MFCGDTAIWALDDGLQMVVSAPADSINACSKLEEHFIVDILTFGGQLQKHSACLKSLPPCIQAEAA